MPKMESGSTPAASTKSTGKNRGHSRASDKTSDKTRPAFGVAWAGHGSTLVNLANRALADLEGFLARDLRHNVRVRHWAWGSSLESRAGRAFLRCQVAQLRALRWATMLARAAAPGPEGLAACPWCRTATGLHVADYGLRQFVVCSRCGVQGPEVDFDTLAAEDDAGDSADLARAAARQLWNTWGSGLAKKKGCTPYPPLTNGPDCAGRPFQIRHIPFPPHGESHVIVLRPGEPAHHHPISDPRPTLRRRAKMLPITRMQEGHGDFRVAVDPGVGVVWVPTGYDLTDPNVTYVCASAWEAVQERSGQ